MKSSTLSLFVVCRRRFYFSALLYLGCLPCARYASSKELVDKLNPWTVAPVRREAANWTRTCFDNNFPNSSPY